jgi:hypothetical protein
VCFPCINPYEEIQGFINHGFRNEGKYNCCKKLESFVWSNIEYIKDLYYRIKIDEKLVLEGDSSNYLAYSYNINFDSLDDLIKESIEYLDF